MFIAALLKLAKLETIPIPLNWGLSKKTGCRQQASVTIRSKDGSQVHYV